MCHNSVKAVRRHADHEIRVFGLRDLLQLVALSRPLLLNVGVSHVLQHLPVQHVGVLQAVRRVIISNRIPKGKGFWSKNITI